MTTLEFGDQGNGDGLPPGGFVTDTTTELPELLRVLQAIRDGDFTVRLPGHWTGIMGKLAADSALRGDVPVVQGTLVVSILLILACNLCVNVLLGVLQPAARRRS